VISFSAYALITFLSNTIGVKAEKRLNLVETAYAQDVEYCLDPVGCYCLSAETSECSAIADGDECIGTVSLEPCEDKTVDTELEAKLLQEKIGETPEAGQKSVSALITSAKKDLNPMKISSPFDLLAGGVNILLAFMGSIALLFYIYAGFTWMSAGGSADKITKAKKILIWTTFGILAMSGSYMLVKTILDKIG
jgi:hypothetical protein